MLVLINGGRPGGVVVTVGDNDMGVRRRGDGGGFKRVRVCLAFRGGRE